MGPRRIRCTTRGWNLHWLRFCRNLGWASTICWRLRIYQLRRYQFHGYNRPIRPIAIIHNIMEFSAQPIHRRDRHGRHSLDFNKSRRRCLDSSNDPGHNRLSQPNPTRTKQLYHRIHRGFCLCPNLEHKRNHLDIRKRGIRKLEQHRMESSTRRISCSGQLQRNRTNQLGRQDLDHYRLSNTNHRRDRSFLGP